MTMVGIERERQKAVSKAIFSASTPESFDSRGWIRRVSPVA